MALSVIAWDWVRKPLPQTSLVDAHVSHTQLPWMLYTGKTLQALVAIALAHEDTEGPEKDLDKRFDQRRQSLVICPSSIVGHWMYEIRQFFPLQSVFQPVCYVGSVATRRRLRENDFFPSNLVVTSYAVLRSDIDYLGRLSWCYCVLDEGHLLRNPRTGKVLREISSYIKMFH